MSASSPSSTKRTSTPSIPPKNSPKNLARHGIDVVLDKVDADGKPIGEVLEAYVRVAPGRRACDGRLWPRPMARIRPRRRDQEPAVASRRSRSCFRIDSRSCAEGSKDRTTTRPQLKVRRVSLDTGRENVVVISRHSSALRPEVFRGFSRVELRAIAKVLLATLLITDDDALVGPDEIGLSEPAFRRFAEPVGQPGHGKPRASPESLDAVRAKIQGRTLKPAEIEAIINDLTHYRYSDMEIAAFLIGSASFMTSGELLALVQAMARAGTQLKWPSPIVVDKHCIGGIPGNRTSMIVVPIVAAHGLTIPKTSSRAITSPAGTADTMEVLTRVDVGVEEMKEVVAACRGCLVWGGHVNLSPADDILISVERPLSLDTREQMVASIMSKKLAAGSTHLLIDLPVGPTAKLANANEAMRLRKLFEFVGDHFGIAVEVITTDGRQPIGNGIGPVLEAEDVMAVLTNDADGPADLREKSLRLAAHLLEYDPQLRGGSGYARARELLDSGAALKKMQDIIDAQGPSTCRNDVGKLTFDVVAADDGDDFRDRLPAVEPPGANRRRADRQGRRHQAVQQDRRPRREGPAALSHLTPMTSPNSILPRPPQRRTAVHHRRPGMPHPAGRRREREPSFRACRLRRATPPGSRRGLAFRFTRSPSMRFPTAKYG